MTFLNSVFLGIAGGFFGMLPVSLSGHLLFWEKSNVSVIGKNPLSLGNGGFLAVYFGIFCAIMLIFGDNVISSFKAPKKENLISILSYTVVTALYVFLFDNVNYSSVLMAVFLFVTAVITFLSDYKFQKWGNIIFLVFCGICGLGGMSEIAFIFFASKILYKRNSFALKETFTLYTVFSFIKAILYLIKALIFGFGISFLNIFVLWIFAFITSVFMPVILKKLSKNRKLKIASYYTLAFALIVIYTFVRG